MPPKPHPHPIPQRLQAAEHAASAAAFQENLAHARAEASSDRMLQAESQLQLRLQELESVRETLAEVQAAVEAVTSDRDALRQALSNQDKAMQAMKAYIGSIAAAPAPAPAPPPSVAEHAVDSSAARGGISQQVLEALEAQLKAAKQVCRMCLLLQCYAAADSMCRCCWSRMEWAITSPNRRMSSCGDGGQRWTDAAGTAHVSSLAGMCFTQCMLLRQLSTCSIVTGL